MKKYKVTLNGDAMLALCRLLQHIVETEGVADCAQKMHFSALAEVMQAVKKKLLVYSSRYKMTLTATQALAMQLLYEDYVQDENRQEVGYLENQLRMIAEDVNQKFQ